MNVKDLAGPVPVGISLTDKPRSTPWNTPPKFVNINEVAQAYIDGLSSSSGINSILDLVESNVPLSSLANAMMLGGVAKNQHTIDTGILVIPVIIEMLATVAEMHGVKYIVFAKDPDDDIIPNRIIKNAIEKSKKSVTKEDTAPILELSGLMTRKSKMENM